MNNINENILGFGFLGMAIIGGIGVSLGFPPLVGGLLGFCVGAFYGSTQ